MPRGGKREPKEGKKLGRSVGASARVYSTSFPGTENPICESGNWQLGKSAGSGACTGIAGGLDWNDMATQPGFVYNITGSGTSDGTAVVTGAWGADMYIRGIAKCNGSDTNPEIEFRVKTTITAHSITGYEGDFACNSVAGQFIHIVRWNGPQGNFTTLTPGNSNGVSTGDVVEMLYTSGTCVMNIKVNGAAKGTATDCTYTTGNPGVGSEQSVGASTDQGWTSFYATDSLVTIAPTCDHATGTYGSSFTNTCSTTSPGTVILCWSTSTTPVTNAAGTGCSTGTSLANGGSITISATQTFNIVAGTSSLSDSSTTTYSYTIGGVQAAPAPAIFARVQNNH